jgi:hypothetical protein
MPLNAIMREVRTTSSISAAQGQRLDVLGVTTLFISVGNSRDIAAVYFFVVEKLVVPVLLGTPWIDRFVRCMTPKSRTAEIQLSPGGETFEVSLRQSPTRNDAIVAVAKACAILPFSETWVRVRCAKSGLSLVRPSRRRDRIVAAKNAVLELPAAGETFLCLVANFSQRPVWIRKGESNRSRRDVERGSGFRRRRS